VELGRCDLAEVVLTAHTAPRGYVRPRRGIIGEQGDHLAVGDLDASARQHDDRERTPLAPAIEHQRRGRF
jgi:hypothetical protein